MALEPITRKEKIIAGQDLTPITRMEMFLKQHAGGGGGGSGGGSGGVTTLHINVTAVNRETMKATFTADKTPAEMAQATATGPVWCVVTFAAGIMDDSAVSIGVPPAWLKGEVAFGVTTEIVHNGDGSNKIAYAVRGGFSDSWILKLNAFAL